MTFSIKALIIMGSFETFSVNDIQYNDTQNTSFECHYAECPDYLNAMLSLIMLNFIMLSVIMLSAVMMSAVMLNVIMLSVVMLNVVILSVVAPQIKLKRPFK
jgi:hypothetical protein